LYCGQVFSNTGQKAMLVAVSERPSHSTSLKSRVALLSVHAPRVISVIGFMQFWNGKQNSPVHDWH